MSEEAWFILALAAVGGYFLYHKGRADVTTEVNTANPGSATDPTGSLIGSGIPFGPSGPPGNTGFVGPALPTGDTVGTGDGTVLEHAPPRAVNF